MIKKKHEIQERTTFKALLQSVERFTKEDVDFLMEDLDDWGFFKMPASCRKHGSYEGGLAQHSLQLLHRLFQLCRCLFVQIYRNFYPWTV